MTSEYNILLWDTFDVLENDDFKCEGTFKNGKVCGRKCNKKVKIDNKIVYTCKTHFPKEITQLPTHTHTTKKIDSYSLQSIAKVVLLKIQQVYTDNIHIFEKVTKIHIELQPKINQKLKYISHIIHGKLTELYLNFPKTIISFVSASKKLRIEYTGPEIICNLKGEYAKRKFMSIQYCMWYLENKFDSEEMSVWNCKLNLKTKQADMADTFCMAVNLLYGIPPKVKSTIPGKFKRRYRIKK